MKWMCKLTGDHSYIPTKISSVVERMEIINISTSRCRVNSFLTKTEEQVCKCCGDTKEITYPLIQLNKLYLINVYHLNLTPKDYICKLHGKPFVKLDVYFPYHTEECKCEDCIKEKL